MTGKGLRPIRALFLTVNAEQHSTTRVLSAILARSAECGVIGRVVLPKSGGFEQWLRVRNVPVLVSSMPWPDWRLPMKSAAALLRVAAWGAFHAVDVIHCNDCESYPFALHLRGLLNKPIVCHVRYDIGRAFAEWAFRRHRRPDALMWNSFYMQERGANAVAGIVEIARQHVVRLCVDPELFGHGEFDRKRQREQWRVPEDAILISTASVIQQRKRLEDFIAALERIGAANPRVHAILAGAAEPREPEYVQRILSHIERSSLGARIKYVGYVSPVEPLYRASDVVISTSLFETFGNSIAEAMACGTPIVAYRGGAVGEIVDDAGFVVEDGDVLGLTKAIRMLVDDERLRQERGRAAKARMLAEFSPHSTAAALLKVYAEIGVTNAAEHYRRVCAYSNRETPAARVCGAQGIFRNELAAY